MQIATAIPIRIWAGIFIATRHIFGLWRDWAFMDSADFLN